MPAVGANEFAVQDARRQSTHTHAGRCAGESLPLLGGFFTGKTFEIWTPF